MSEPNGKENGDLNSINTKRFLIGLCLVAVVILGFYFGNFHGGLSTENGVWGTFGDYVGGILNPLIASFAFYLIAETYKLQKEAYNLQKTELEETRKLLEISTKAQEAQVNLAALTAQHNLNLTRISALELEKMSLLEREDKYSKRSDGLDETIRKIQSGNHDKPETYSTEKMNNINSEIKRLKNKNTEIEEKIETFDLNG